jgi:hypothetical protein
MTLGIVQLSLVTDNRHKPVLQLSIKFVYKINLIVTLNIRMKKYVLIF